MDSPTVSGAVGRGERDCAVGATGGWDSQWEVAQSDERGAPAGAAVGAAVGGGKLLQRTQAHDGRGPERTPSRSDVGVRPAPLAGGVDRRCFQQSMSDVSPVL